MPSTSRGGEPCFFDAGLFIAGLLKGDPRHGEARPILAAARTGQTTACTTASVLSEAYAALTSEKAHPRHNPASAAEAIRVLIREPSRIQVLPTGADALLKTLKLAASHRLAGRRVHDARHAATALVAGIHSVYTYDVGDWQAFEADGLKIAGPASVMRLLGRSV